MNCLLEAVATVYLATRKRLMPEPVEEQVYTAQDNLESCRKTMEGREAELSRAVLSLGREAVARRSAGDMSGARSKVLERQRAQRRLDKLRSGLTLVENQLDAIKTSELDKEIMLSLKASTVAMKRAGVSLVVKDVEKVMDDLDDQLASVQDITSVLTNPLSSQDDIDIDAELDWLEEGGVDTDKPRPLPAPPAPAQPAPDPAPESAVQPPAHQNAMGDACT